MEIPLIYVLISAELMLVFFGLALTFGIMLLRRPSAEATSPESELENAEDTDGGYSGKSYIEYLEQEQQRNQKKLKQQENIEADELTSDSEPGEDVIELGEESVEETSEASTEESSEDEQPTAPPPDEQQSALLQAREEFLAIERNAAEHSEHDINFWEHIYQGMTDLVKKLKTLEVRHTSSTENTETIVNQKESKEKVFYIETQGKKIDGEVNRLKDIIYEQENALNSMKKALNDGNDELTDSETVDFLKEQLANIERQLNDSKMCMEVLEMENDRLQQEIDQLEAMSLVSGATEGSESGSDIDIEQLKQNLTEHEARIQELLETINSLELEAEQAEKLREIVSNFTLSSKEMLNSISELEEENERLQRAIENNSEKGSDATNSMDSQTEDSGDTEQLKAKVSQLEEELIKKEVAYAQLQDEFSSMETEYLAMYEAMHGDGN